MTTTLTECGSHVQSGESYDDRAGYLSTLASQQAGRATVSSAIHGGSKELFYGVVPEVQTLTVGGVGITGDYFNDLTSRSQLGFTD